MSSSETPNKDCNNIASIPVLFAIVKKKKKERDFGMTDIRMRNQSNS